MSTQNATDCAYLYNKAVSPWAWANVHDTAAATYFANGNLGYAGFRPGFASPDWIDMSRACLKFDTTGLTIVSASIACTASKSDHTGSSYAEQICLYGFTPDDVDAVDANDYLHTKWGTTKLSNEFTLVDNANIDVTFTLNAAGIAYLNAAGGKIWLGIRTTRDAENNAGWSHPSGTAGYEYLSAYEANTVLTYSEGAASVIRNNMPISKLNNVPVASINR